MFEQAEKYARETILPLVSTYTPKFITEFIGPRPEPKYVPLHYEEETEVQETSSSEKLVTHRSQSRSLPESFQDNLVSSTHLESVQETTTPYTHIQRIIKKVRTSEEDSSESTNFISQRKDLSRKTRDHYNQIGGGSRNKEIYIDLPVFDDSLSGIKYIPLNEGP